jgi:predicted MFS family arabinose efflux permease
VPEPDLTTPAAAAPDPPPQFQIPTPLLILLLGACGFASTFSMRLLDPLVPLLAQDLQRSINEVAVLASAYAFAYALGQPVLGALGDSFGKARTIAWCCITAGVGSLVCAVAVSFELLLVARFLSGVLAGGIIPLSMAAIGDRVALPERQSALSRLMLTSIVGQMGGIAASGFVADLLGWRYVFLAAAVLAFVAGGLVRVRLKPRPASARRPFSVAGAVSGYRGVLGNRKALPLYLIVFIEGSLVQGLNPYAAAILKEREGVGASGAGLVLGAAALGGLLYAVFAPRIVRTIGPRRMAIAGGILIATGMALFGLPRVPWFVAPSFFFLIGFGFFLLHNNLQTQATELSQTHRGSAVALFACSFFAGQAFGPLIFGVTLPLLGTTGALVLSGAAIATLGVVAARVLRL